MQLTSRGSNHDDDPIQLYVIQELEPTGSFGEKRIERDLLRLLLLLIISTWIVTWIESCIHIIVVV